MTGTIDVTVVTVVSGVLDVSDVDGDTSLSLLRGLVNGRVVNKLGTALGGQDGCDSWKKKKKKKS